MVGSLVVANRPVDERINFLTPKKGRPKTDWRRAAAIAGAGLLLGLFLAGNRYRASQEEVLDKAISVAKKKKSERDRDAKALRRERDQLAFIQNWQARDVNWLNTLRTLLVAMPEANKLFLTRMQMDSASTSKEAIGSIQLEGFADDSKTILDFNSRLSDELGLLVDPGAIQPAPRFEGYNWRYSAKIGIPRDWKGMRKLGIPERLPTPTPRHSTDLPSGEGSRPATKEGMP